MCCFFPTRFATPADHEDYIEIWCGHSENLIPRLKERLPEKSIDILFFDQQGTKMHLVLWWHGKLAVLFPPTDGL